MYDLIIIGMGPAGMSAGVYAKRSGLNVLMLESSAPGGAILKAKTINNYLGFKNISGPDLALEMFNHINSLDVKYKVEKVLKINNGDEKEVITDKHTYKTKTVLITSGKGINKLIINGKNISANNLSFCTLCDGALYKDKNVILIKNKNDDNEEQFLKNIVNNLYVIPKESIKDIEVNNDIITKVITDKEINVDGVFVSDFDNVITEFDKELNIRENGKIVVNNEYETKVDGIYAAGDVIKKEVYQVSTAVGEGASAAISIIKKLGE